MKTKGVFVNTEDVCNETPPNNFFIPLGGW